MRLKKISLILVVCLLFLPTIPNTYANGKTDGAIDTAYKTGTYSEKHEVVYATLHPDGAQKEMYVVNQFVMDELGKAVDYGPYSSVKNLTNVLEMDQKGEQIKFIADADQFYYQGDVADLPLPWDIKIEYTLDGKVHAPEELVGESGKLEISIQTDANDNVNEVFFQHYLLQISIPFDSSQYQNIEAENGMIASVGKNKQVTFTILPEKKADVSVKADVIDLELESIEIAAMPFSMFIDMPDADEVTKGMETLADATLQIDEGVGELKNGVATLNQGASSLYDGSEKYLQGIKGLNKGSADLIKGSSQIDQSLVDIVQSLNISSDEIPLEDMKVLQKGLASMALGLDEMATGISSFQGQFEQARQLLDESMEQIPEPALSDGEIEALYTSGADVKVVEHLIQTYMAAQTSKAVYDKVKEAFNAVDPTFDQLIGSVQEVSKNIELIADEVDKSMASMDLADSIQQLQEGLGTLSSHYQTFHAGLVEYMNGVAALSTSYSELHGGISQLTNGTSQLEKGVMDLHTGTTELADSTSDLPDQIQREMDEMIESYDKSNFEPLSFVSNKNEHVKSVQFVIKTESVKQDQEEEPLPMEEKEKGFWERLLDLFR